MIRGASPPIPAVVYLSAATSLVLGLAFIFIRAPHPWGWEGFDHYHELGLALARGEPFPTTDVPWGYAYFLSFFYRYVGDRPWVPLTVQACLNAATPLLLYHLVAHQLDRRSAIVAASMAGVLSFNTVYASTQSSDAVCTVLVLAAVTLFVRALETGRIAAFVTSGLLCGLATQFRPNLLLLAPVLAVVGVALGRSRTFPGATAFVLAAASATLPWVIHNYRLAGEFLPTSTHGAVQLWYRSLQTGRYLSSRAHNPRSLFETATFDSTSLPNQSILVDAVCDSEKPARVDAIFWTDRSPGLSRVHGEVRPHAIAFTFPGQPARTVLYYYFVSVDSAGTERFSPARGPQDPYVFFIDDRHLSDIDAHQDLLDGFDLVRAARAMAWHEPAPPLTDLDRDGGVTEADVRLAAAALAHSGERRGLNGPDVVATVRAADDAVTIRFVDGSTLRVPRQWRNRITDVELDGALAAQVIAGRRRVASLPVPGDVAGRVQCLWSENIRVNDVFYRREPHLMHRYTALALDNIGRDPLGFAAASIFRAVRLFVVVGTDDVHTTQQFTGGQRVYLIATAMSTGILILAVIGVVIAVLHGQRVSLLLTPIVYVPATICVVLTNMRYSVTVQPFLFAFAAVALTAAADWWTRPAAAPEGAAATGTRTAPRP